MASPQTLHYVIHILIQVPASTVSSALLQRLASSVRTLGSPSPQSTLDLESGEGRSGVEASTANGTDSEGTSTDAVRAAETSATADPPSTQHARPHLGEKETEDTWRAKFCDFMHGLVHRVATAIWVSCGILFRDAFIASLMTAVCGFFLLGLAKGPEGLYANVSVLSLVVACACGSGVVAGGCAGLMLVLGTREWLQGAVQGIASLATIFIPAIAIGVTHGHIRGLNPAFTAVDALKAGGVGFGGLFPCYCLYLCCVGIENGFESERKSTTTVQS